MMSLAALCLEWGAGMLLSGEGSRSMVLPEEGTCGALWRGGYEPPSVCSVVDNFTYTSDVSTMDAHAYHTHIHT